MFQTVPTAPHPSRALIITPPDGTRKVVETVNMDAVHIVGGGSTFICVPDPRYTDVKVLGKIVAELDRIPEGEFAKPVDNTVEPEIELTDNADEDIVIGVASGTAVNDGLIEVGKVDNFERGDVVVELDVDHIYAELTLLVELKMFVEFERLK
jgi:hypothetical protein